MKIKNVSKKLVAILAIIVILLSMPIVNLAHSGRTDANGGHKDNKNKSGLGPYHYHCGGHPAHLHDGGGCPYTNSPALAATTSTSSGSISSTSSTTTTTTTPKKANPSKVEVDVKDLEILIGESKKLTATVLPSNAEDKSVTWKSSDKEIVMVDSEGEILALGIGDATITVTTSNGKETCVNVSVKPIKVTEIKLNESEVNLKIGESVILAATVIPENATDKNIEWSSENPEIATVENGEIKAIASGTTKIICSSKDEIKSEVNVIIEEIIEEENTVEVVAETVDNDDNSNNKENEEVKSTTEITPIANAGMWIALASIVGLPIYGFKTRNKEEKFSFKNFVGNLISYLLCFMTLLLSVGATSILGLIITLATALSISPPICKIINQRISGKYTVKIRIITYIVGFILMIVML